jgi:hypothetical protein
MLTVNCRFRFQENKEVMRGHEFLEKDSDRFFV